MKDLCGIFYIFILNFLIIFNLKCYPPASEASRGVYWNQAQKNFTHPYSKVKANRESRTQNRNRKICWPPSVFEPWSPWTKSQCDTYEQRWPFTNTFFVSIFRSCRRRGGFAAPSNASSANSTCQCFRSRRRNLTPSWNSSGTQQLSWRQYRHSNSGQIRIAEVIIADGFKLWIF